MNIIYVLILAIAEVCVLVWLGRKCERIMGHKAAKMWPWIAFNGTYMLFFLHEQQYGRAASNAFLVAIFIVMYAVDLREEPKRRIR